MFLARAHTRAGIHLFMLQCDVGEAVLNLFDLIHTENELLTLIVYSCTKVLKVIGEVAQFFNLTVVSCL